MNKKILATAILFFTLFMSAIPASAWYIEMNNLDGDDTVEIWFMVDEEAGETVRLRTFILSFCFDSSEVAWINEYTNNLPSGFTQDYTPTKMNTEYMMGIDGDGSCFEITEDYLLGTYTIEVLDGAVQDGDPDIYFPTEYSTDYSYYSLLVQTFEDQTVYMPKLINQGYLVNGSGLDFGTAVPVPGSLLIMCTGLSGLLAVRRRSCLSSKIKPLS